MSQPTDTRPASPCINICRMDSARRYCQGCRRTTTEIGLWDGMTDAQRAFVIEALPARRGRPGAGQP
ncbi:MULTISPECIES: DUF1289 domain-containing protein [unclassified Cupriavidus]|jgi:uncharacterized protein|uniref:DUF1289 domain-containing protein n=1 Tax=unclassified Cupriavidus TaxID=2640874 RepID=UPI001C005E3A|nr:MULTISPECIES: DUF1289 domain-containing protein [unclassified Cupriavidus]MCA3192427.1 DUF1289 domain-containing protein [Cupriavidus sp.]MCA3198961.1 DUF1289 domain-containing protein [Cupriavidus sp.]MCA3205323.1 DUF1289 domain-containing protein [Cupriavidus sp.]MCA3207243.1 DUF1289 domain-containing protein [Cupriavidus sp.]MCA3232017.1 DUF1289 domain-containing protein [Cupriavidus sp.]